MHMMSHHQKKSSLMILKSLTDQRFITQDTCLNFYIYFPFFNRESPIVRKRTDVSFKNYFALLMCLHENNLNFQLLKK